MAVVPPVLIPSSRRGFSLIEVLVAISLASIVMALAWIVLDSTQKVSIEIDRPIGHPWQPLASQLQFEFDRLLPEPVELEDPPLRFNPEEGLQFVALLPNDQGIPLQTQVHYLQEDQNLLRISTSGFPPSTQTNRVLNGLRTFEVLAYPEGIPEDADQADELKLLEWPEEKEEDPEMEETEEEDKNPFPAQLKVEFISIQGSRFIRSFYLPASFRIEKEDQAEKEEPAL
ncbi:prepilin-type N-terminal cleavage/methylation domain-containing protein [Kiritimatiellota bacterium B12222]|nr:prepilin-type N-terminal cleavage/methylation domain-containing protein [Kiritimatiellota bacterium B12222]